jgi:hypothetical protein
MVYLVFCSEQKKSDFFLNRISYTIDIDFRRVKIFIRSGVQRFSVGLKLESNASALD